MGNELRQIRNNKLRVMASTLLVRKVVSSTKRLYIVNTVTAEF